MYSVDEKDTVVALDDLPQSSVGAPCPLVFAAERQLLVAYYTQNVPKDWDGTTVRVIDPDTSQEPAALVRFERPYASIFGPPNDEAFSGHPLASRGLRPYGAYEIKESSWIRSLEKMNSVHPYHRAEHFSKYRHFVLSFHDSTFECVATGYSVDLAVGPLSELVARTIVASRE